MWLLFFLSSCVKYANVWNWKFFFHSNLLKPLEMALSFGSDKWYSYCIITTNSCFHILLNNLENPLHRLYFSPCAGVHRHCNIMPSLIVFQNKIVVRIYRWKFRCWKFAVKTCFKLVSIFPANFSSRETNSSPALLAFLGQVYLGEESEVLYLLCLKLGKRNKARKRTELKLYNLTFNIWIRKLGKSW